MLTLEQALAALPDTANEIAVHLYGLGVRGVREDDCACPIAMYLKGLGFERVKVDRFQIEVWSTEHGDEDATPSKGVADFIRRFDYHAEYSTLDIDYAGPADA